MFRTKSTPKGVIFCIWLLFVQSSELLASNIQQASVPTGPAGGSLAGTYPNPTLSLTGVSAGTFGSATQVPVFTVTTEGRITSVTNTTISGIAPSGAAGGGLAGTYPNPTIAGVTTAGALATGSGVSGVLTQLTLGTACGMLYAGASSPAYSTASKLCWDEANGRLGIGTATPSLSLTVLTTAAQDGIEIRSATAIVPTFLLRNTGSARAGGFRLAGGSSDLFQFGGGQAGTSISAVQFGTDIFGTAANPYIDITSSRIAAIGAMSVGPNNTGTSGTFSCYDATATTGSTNCSFRAGAGQSGTVLRILNNAGTEVSGLTTTFWNAGNVGLFQSGTTALKTGYAASYFGSGAVTSSGPDSPSFAILAATVVMGSRSTGLYGWAGSSTDASAALDTAIGRTSAGVGQVNNGTLNTYRGWEVSYLASRGTTFTASGCSVSSLTGGATAGTFVSGTTGACTPTITFGNSATATTGWACQAANRTTSANLFQQTASTTTTATFTGTTVTNDVISFSCIAY